MVTAPTVFPSTVTSIPWSTRTRCPPIRRSVNWSGRNRPGVHAGARRGGTRPRGDHPRRQKGMTGSIFFILAGVVLLYSTFFSSSSSPSCWTPGSGGGWRSWSYSSACCWAPRCSGCWGGARSAGSAAPADHRDRQGNPRGLHRRPRQVAGEEPRPGRGGAPGARSSRPTHPGGDGRVTARPDPSVTRIAGPWRHLDVHANGIRFHVVEAQPPPARRPTASRPPPARW